MVCEKVFQDEGVVADVTLAEYPLDFIPFDSDILTLELDSAYKVCAVISKLCSLLRSCLQHCLLTCSCVLV